MSKKVEITVVVQLSDPIYADNELDEVAANVARAIATEASSGKGITPEDSEAYTVSVYTTAKHSSTGNEYVSTTY